MKRLAVCLLALAFAAPAAAQQATPEQTALAINQAVTSMAMALSAAQQQMARSAADSEGLRKQIEALRAKCGDPCKDVK